MSSLRFSHVVVLCWLALSFWSAPVWGQAETTDDRTQPWPVKLDDGMTLDAVLDLPPGLSELSDARRVIILVHGSGAHSMDADLTVVTKDREPNLFFKTIGSAIAEQGFVVVRYNKRNYQLGLWMKDDSKREQARSLATEFGQNPLKYFVEDLKSVYAQAKQSCPQAEFYFLGHSEGCYTALQAAHELKTISGVALIGYSEYSVERLMFTQTVYRPLFDFMRLDQNGDGELDAEELAADDPFAKAFAASLQIVDMDRNGRISRTEMQATNLANLFVNDLAAPFRKQEANYPRLVDILKSAQHKTAFFQGMLDNQTPAYYALAVRLLFSQLGKDKNMRFEFFDGLGHALDPRERYEDTVYRPIDPAALKKMVNVLNEFFVTDHDNNK